MRKVVIILCVGLIPFISAAKNIINGYFIIVSKQDQQVVTNFP